MKTSKNLQNMKTPKQLTELVDFETKKRLMELAGITNQLPEGNILKRGISNFTTALSLNNNLLNRGHSGSTSNTNALKSNNLKDLLLRLKEPRDLIHIIYNGSIKEIITALESVLEEFSSKKHWSDIQKKYTLFQKCHEGLTEKIFLIKRQYDAQKRPNNFTVPKSDQDALVSMIKKLYDISYNEGY